MTTTRWPTTRERAILFHGIRDGYWDVPAYPWGDETKSAQRSWENGLWRGYTQVDHRGSPEIRIYLFPLRTGDV